MKPKNGWLVRFYGISAIVGYLILNPLYTYILIIYYLLTRFLDNIFKQTRAHPAHKYHVFLSNMNNSIDY